MVGTILRPALLASTALVGIGVRRLDAPSVLHLAASPGMLRARLTRLLALAVEPASSLLARLGGDLAGSLAKRARRTGPVARLRRRWHRAALALSLVGSGLGAGPLQAAGIYTATDPLTFNLAIASANADPGSEIDIRGNFNATVPTPATTQLNLQLGTTVTGGYTLGITNLAGPTGSVNAFSDGAGVLNLTGTNTFNGLLTSLITLGIDGEAALGSGSVRLDSTTLKALGNVTITSRPIAIGALGVTVDTNGNTLSIGTVISGTGNVLNVVGGGTAVLSGANTFTASGGMTVSGNSTLSAASATALSNAAVTVTGGSTLNVNNVTIANNLTLNGTGVAGAGGALTGTGTAGVSGTVNLASNTTVSTDGTLTLSGIVSGRVLTTAGTGTVILTNANTYANPVAGAAGTLVGSGSTLDIRNNAALGGSSAAVIGGGTLALEGGITVGNMLALSGTGVGGGGALRNVSGTNTYGGTVTLATDSRINSDTGSSLTLSAASAVTGAHVLTLGGAGNGTVSGAISTNALVKDGSGTWALTGNNAGFGGSVTIAAGTLQANSTAALGNETGINTLIFNGGTLQATGAITSAATRGVTMTGAGTIDTNGNPVSIAGVITGAGGLTKVGAGTLTLSGTNSGVNAYTGTVNVNAGTLSVNGTFGDTAATPVTTVNVNSGGTLHGTGRILGTVVVNSGGTVSAGNSPGTTTYTNYTLNTGSTTVFELNTPNVVGGGVNDLIQVTNNLTVNSGAGLTLQTTGGATPTSGVYRIFTYGTLTGALTNFNTTVAGGGTANLYTVNSGINVRVFGAGQITQYWDGTDTTGASPGAQGGTATWNATNTNWVDDPTNGTANDIWRSQAGVFGNGTTNNGAPARTVTVDGAQSFQSLRFSDNNYTLVAAGTGGTLNLVGNPFAAVAADQPYSSITVDAGNTAVLNLPLTGAGLLKLGTGTLNLGGANTYTGLGTRIDAGTLAILAGGSVASQVTNNATFTNAGTVNAGVTNSATGTATNTNSITGNVSNSGGFTNSGSIGGTVGNTGGTFGNTGTGTITGLVTNNATFNNAGTLNGGLNNAAGTYTQTAGATNGGITNAATINANGGAFGGAIANNAGAFNVGGAVTANNTFTNSGNATLSLGGGSSLTGITILTQNSTGAVSTAVASTLSAGGLAGTTAGATIANAGTLNLVGGVGDTSYAGTITGTGPVNKSGTGVQTLTGVNGPGAQYTGAVAVNGGTLQISGTFGNTVGNTATMTVGAAGTLVGAGGTFAGNVTNNGTVAAGAAPGTGQVGTLTIGGSYTIAAGSTNAFDLGTPNVVDGPTNDLITVGGTLTIAGGTLALTNASASGLYRLYTVGGAVTTAAAANAGFTTVTTTNGTATVFTVPGTGTPGPSQVNVRISNGGQLVQYWDGTDLTGAVPGAQGGTGIWNATNTNWTDDPAVGQINQNWQSQFGVFLGSGGMVTVQGTQNVQGLQFSSNGYTLMSAGAGNTINLTNDPGGVMPGFGTIRVDAGVSTTIATSITGVGLNKVAGMGTLVLTGTNFFSALNIDDGTVEVQNGTAIADTAPVTISNRAGARLLVTNSETIGSLSGGGTAGGRVEIAAGQTLTTGANNTSTTFAGVIADVLPATMPYGALVKTGTGTFTLTATNTFLGGTTVAQGTLINNGSLASQVTNNAGATFTNNGTVNAGHTNNGTSTNNGLITGNVGNGGTFTNNGTVGGRLTNTNVATNNGTINGGLTNNGGTTTNAASGTINNGAIVNSGTFTTLGTVNGLVTNAAITNAQGAINGDVNNTTTGMFNVTGTLTGIGRLTNDGAFNLGGFNLTIGSLAGTTAGATIANGGTLTTGGDNSSSTYAGRIIGGNTALTKVGTGTFTLSGNNTYGGITTISAGTLAVSGTGIINGSSQILNSAGFTIAAGGQVTTPRVTNNATGTLTTAGTLNATTAITNAGSFTISGGTVTTPNLSNTGTLSQTAGTLNASGITNAGGFTVSGGTVTTQSLSNTGTLSQTGGTINASAFDNAASGIFTQTAAGTLNTATITNEGSFTSAGPVNATTSFTNNASGMLMASGTVTTPTFVNAGRVTGLLTLAGVSQITNLSGALIQDGVSVSAAAGGARLDNAGTIGSGALVINTASGTLNAFNTSGRTFFGYVSSAAGTTSTFTNTATGRWDYQGVGNLAGNDTIVNQGLFSVTAAGGTLNGLERFDNQAGGQVVLNASLGGPITVFDNAGTVGIPAAGGFNGSLGSLAFNNLASGTISLQNGQVTDRLTLGGTYAGTAGSHVAIDVDLSRADAGMRGDVLVVTGADSGSSLLNVNVVNSGRVFFSTPIPVVRAGSGTLQLQIDPTRPLPSTGFINYSLEATPGAPGSYDIVSRINPGAAAASVSGISGLITSINVGFFQSVSAFLSGPAQHRLCNEERQRAYLFCDAPTGGGVGVTSMGKSWEQTNQQAAAAPVAAGANASGILPDTYGLGLWARGSGGETTIRSGSTADFGSGASLTGQNKTRIGFAGMQFGGDFAVFNIANSGFNLHMGVTGGQVYASGKELLSSQATGAFEVPFVGFYTAVTSGPFTSDILYRHDYYDARINDPGSGVMNRPLAIASDTVGGSMGYRIDLPKLSGSDQAYFIEPSGQMSYTETRIGALPVTGGVLTFRPIESILGRIGFRAGTNVKLGDVLALQPFVTAAVWNEFADKAASRFTAQTILTDPNAFVPILTNRVGTFGQAGVGVAGQLLGTDLLGYVRADFRFGDRIEGYSVNGGLRYPF